MKQRYQCKSCGKYQQNNYSHRTYNHKDDKQIRRLNAEGVGNRSMSRILGYSPQTVIRQILQLKTSITKPIYHVCN